MQQAALILVLVGLIGGLAVGLQGPLSSMIGQLMTRLVIDHFGLLDAAVRPIDLSRILGVVILFVGVYLIVR
jgi:transporter family-2 protein